MDSPATVELLEESESTIGVILEESAKEGKNEEKKRSNMRPTYKRSPVRAGRLATWTFLLFFRSIEYYSISLSRNLSFFIFT